MKRDDSDRGGSGYIPNNLVNQARVGTAVTHEQHEMPCWGPPALRLEPCHCLVSHVTSAELGGGLREEGASTVNQERKDGRLPQIRSFVENIAGLPEGREIKM